MSEMRSEWNIITQRATSTQIFFCGLPTEGGENNKKLNSYVDD